jgi:hypothetical protein
VQADESVSSPDEVSKLIDNYSGDAWRENVLSLQLTGKLEEEAVELWQERRAEIRDSVLELRLDDSDVRRKVTPEQIRKEFSKGSFPEQLLSTFSDEHEEDELQMAYELIKEVKQ